MAAEREPSSTCVALRVVYMSTDRTELSSVTTLHDHILVLRRKSRPPQKKFAECESLFSGSLDRRRAAGGVREEEVCSARLTRSMALDEDDLTDLKVELFLAGICGRVSAVSGLWSMRTSRVGAHLSCV
ncbi:hypothetical protein MPTK1_2g22960 [Marchantia polymorpha subsp. ruderalis]|uniref:Uncharacterized protein n=1 Tax=Marchantia polymorpha TaxID=3197 RepID=A0A2R6WN52_MARPO|nr:hypothetical protein MARPO_0072s0035 [Marchantia polymorpha]BBN03363.1 hypothetical protein Mp_2g22960 [Marchantia polymorpha subsp. ruderalis]|eukprot:PTQ35288.1 hypothetical protein MARPO_0072s0035 [Marchantia polymorpha]